MTHEEILRALASLPPEGQRQVADFIAFLNQHYEHAHSDDKAATSDLTSEEFVGMWRDRIDMKDSSAWVRNLRESEWVK